MASEFKIGGKVVCIKTHSQHASNGVVKGASFKVNALRQDHCTCHSHLLVDIGIITPFSMNQCPTCKLKYPSHGVWWISSLILAPLDELESQETIDELLDRILESEKQKA